MAYTFNLLLGAALRDPVWLLPVKIPELLSIGKKDATEIARGFFRGCLTAGVTLDDVFTEKLEFQSLFSILPVDSQPFGAFRLVIETRSPSPRHCSLFHLLIL